MITAIVLAALGWQDVVHDRTERAEGMRADHQLDVTCRDREGKVRRLLIECKEWDTQDVRQDEMIKLYSVRDELGASDAAMITKRSFTKGARDTAYDHDLAMLRLRAYDPSVDDGRGSRRSRSTSRSAQSCSAKFSCSSTRHGVLPRSPGSGPRAGWTSSRSPASVSATSPAFTH